MAKRTCIVVVDGVMCGKPAVAHERCSAHHQKQRRYGNPLAGRTAPPAKPVDMTERDWVLAGYDRSGGENACHPWTRGTDGTTGYGKSQWQGKPWRTHVIAWMIANNAEVPEGLVICHNCINSRLCGNPKHLRADTPEANVEDMMRDGRSARGSRHSQAKLTEDDVRAIKRRLAEDEICKSIAADFEVSREAINRIKNGRTWWWLTD